jgi:hypothetical protein
MTTIAWCGRYVAADTQVTYKDGLRSTHSFVKVKVIGGVVYACCGSAPLFQPLIDWYLAGHNPKDVPQDYPGSASDLIVFKKDGSCTLFGTNVPYPMEFEAPEAWGSGSPLALVALEMGADARRAVEVTLKFDTSSGGEVQFFDLHEIFKEMAA